MSDPNAPYSPGQTAQAYASYDPAATTCEDAKANAEALCRLVVGQRVTVTNPEPQTSKAWHGIDLVIVSIRQDTIAPNGLLLVCEAVGDRADRVMLEPQEVTPAEA